MCSTQLGVQYPHNHLQEGNSKLRVAWDEEFAEIASAILWRFVKNPLLRACRCGKGANNRVLNSRSP